MHIDVHTEPPITEGNDNHVWQVTDGAQLEVSVPELIKTLEKKNFEEGMTPEEFMTTYVLLIAVKVTTESLDYVEKGKPISWSTVDLDPSTHLFLRKKRPEDDEPEVAPLPDEPPPGFAPTEPETGMATDTNDLPKHNEVQVSGTLPLQHLKISALSWKSNAVGPATGIKNRPISTATMCPSCGRPFAMNIPDDLRKGKMLSNEMERELADTLEAQRAVLEGEKRMLEAEANDLKTAISKLNGGLTQAKEDAAELSQLSDRQQSYTSWLESEIRQTKSEIGEVGLDFDACVKSNKQLTGLVEQAITKRAESKYWNSNVNQRAVGRDHLAGLAPDISTAPEVYTSQYQSKPSTSKKDRLRQLVNQYYQRHNPSKLGMVDTLVDEYRGKERELLSLMAQKYGDATVLAYDPILDDHGIDNNAPSVPISDPDSFGVPDYGVVRQPRARSPPHPHPHSQPVASTKADHAIHELLSGFVGRDVTDQISPERSAPYKGGSPIYPTAQSGYGGGGGYGREPTPSSYSSTLPPGPRPPNRFGGYAASPGGGSQYTGGDSFTGPSSSDPSRVTFADDRPYTAASPSFRDELLRTAPLTMERRTKRAGY